MPNLDCYNLYIYKPYTEKHLIKLVILPRNAAKTPKHRKRVPTLERWNWTNVTCPSYSNQPRVLFQRKTSWWVNQPIWNICSSNFIRPSGRVENRKYLKPHPRKPWRFLYPVQDGQGEDDLNLGYQQSLWKRHMERQNMFPNPKSWKACFILSNWLLLSLLSLKVSRWVSNMFMTKLSYQMSWAILMGANTPGPHHFYLAWLAVMVPMAVNFLVELEV